MEPDASTLTRNGRRLVVGSDIEQLIFNGIVEQPIKNGLIGDEVLHIDGAHLKAGASRKGLWGLPGRTAPRRRSRKAGCY
jgi:transposase